MAIAVPVHRADPEAPGAAGGFDTLESEISVESLPINGSLPSWLTGSLLRTGPARWEFGDAKLRHWFDGQAMLHRFAIGDGRVSYQNRFLQTNAYRSLSEKGEIGFSEFATDPCRSLFKRVQSIFSPALSDNCNVNLTKLGERFIAMTETPIPVEFDLDTLEAAGVAYRPPGELTTAHPHLDRAGGGMVNYAAKLGPRNRYRFFLVGPDATEPELIAEAPVSEPAYMHSFGMTQRWIVMAEFPLVVNPLKLAAGGRPYIENFRWKPELGTRFTLFDRRSGEAVGPITAPARFAFHHVNAYDDGDSVVADICTFPDAGIVEDLYMERLRAGKPVAMASLERFTIDVPRRAVEVRKLTDASFDLPRINYGRCHERRHRYVWGAGVSGETGWIDEIVKTDVDSGAALKWSEAGCYPGEPVFASEPGAPAEDAGVLLSVVFDARRETSFLLVLDAGSLAERARAEVPHHIPFGFHGQFARDVQLGGR